MIRYKVHQYVMYVVVLVLGPSLSRSPQICSRPIPNLLPSSPSSSSRSRKPPQAIQTITSSSSSNKWTLLFNPSAISSLFPLPTRTTTGWDLRTLSHNDGSSQLQKHPRRSEPLPRISSQRQARHTVCDIMGQQPGVCKPSSSYPGDASSTECIHTTTLIHIGLHELSPSLQGNVLVLLQRHVGAI